MSYDISLVDPVSKSTLVVDNKHFMRGGTYCVGGTNELTLNITYNYCESFRKTIDSEKGIRHLYGLTALESIPLLERAINLLSDDVSDDYWDATEGNAKRALSQLLAMARMRPDGVWDGD